MHGVDKIMVMIENDSELISDMHYIIKDLNSI